MVLYLKKIIKIQFLSSFVDKVYNSIIDLLDDYSDIISQDDPLTPMYSLPPVRVTQGEQLDLLLYLASDDQTTTPEVVSSLTEYPGDLL